MQPRVVELRYIIEREDEFDGAGADGEVGPRVAVVDIVIEGGLGRDVIKKSVPEAFSAEDLLEWFTIRS
ncbi:MAG: hypothetical protein Q9180_009921 [Flavoplaca navasiana]